jgi:hypothetical protein
MGILPSSSYFFLYFNREREERNREFQKFACLSEEADLWELI